MIKNTLLLGALAPMLAGLCVATAQAQPQTADQAYCQALAREYKLGFMSRGALPQSLDTDVAIEQCREGKPGPAIPVLEQKLRDGGFTLPPRT
jgi:hypothetical protein